MRLAGMAVLIATTGGTPAAAQAPAPPVHPGLVRVAAEGPDQRAEWERRLDGMVRAGTLKVRESRTSGATRDQWLVQLHKGVPVVGAEVWRRYEGDVLAAAEGVIYERIAVNPVPKLTRAEAVQAVLAMRPGAIGPGRAPDLVVLPEPRGRYVLAYRVAVFDGVDLVVHFLDAATGAVVLSEREPPPPAGR